MPTDRPGMVHLTSAGGQTLTLPSTVTVDGLEQAWRTPSARLVSGGEVAVGAPEPQPFDIFIRGTLYDGNPTLARTRLDTLKLILLNAPVRVRLLGSTDDRYLEAWPQSVGRLNMDGLGQYSSLGVRLRVMNPYWFGNPESYTRNGITTSPEFWTITGVKGNVRPNPVVTFTMTSGASLSNPRIVNTSGSVREFMVPGAFTSGDVLTVDTERMRVYDNDGTSYLDETGDSFLLERWPLSLGSNSLTIYATGTVRMNVAITYRPRWV